MERIIINGKNTVFGRMASFVAKSLLKGKSVDIINCEDILISGEGKSVSKSIIQKRNMGRGSSIKGPKFIRSEEFLVKRMIRGMLPLEKTSGRLAFKRLKCHIGNGNLSEAEVKKAINLEHQIPLKHSTIKQILSRLI